MMGGELWQTAEWNYQQSLDWHLLDYDGHAGVQQFVKDLNHTYKNYPALYEKQFSQEGFQWIDYGDHENSVLTYVRKGHDEKNDLIVACNFTPILREKYRIGNPKKGKLKEILNSDATKYGGSGKENPNIKSSTKQWHGHKKSVEITIPPLGIVILQ